jgi:hypothetical protein
MSHNFADDVFFSKLYDYFEENKIKWSPKAKS